MEEIKGSLLALTARLTDTLGRNVHHQTVASTGGKVPAGTEDPSTPIILAESFGLNPADNDSITSVEEFVPDISDNDLNLKVLTTQLPGLRQ